MKYKELCGICEIVDARKFPGAQAASLVPAHFNLGLGEYIEDKDDLQKKRKIAEAEGKISAWE
ncbi:MAG: hypothetical protein GY820_39540 [Gammaproteobacteria bacterium]|nr:hypothetical protein [Gammaproteobacteria bacterium]